MKFSLAQLLAPFVGGLAGFLASKGLVLTADQTLALTTLLAGVLGGAVHLVEVTVGNPLHQLLSGASSSSGPITNIAAKPDPAKKGSGSGGWVSAETLPWLAILLLCTVLLIAASIGGCAATGTAAPQSADESIAYGYGVYTALETALSTAVADGSVTKDQARAVDAKASVALGLLGAARAAEQAADAATSSSDLAAALSALTALQAWLQKPSAEVP